MLPIHAPIIVAGQLYLNEELNEYMIVTRSGRGQVFYAGAGFQGHSEDQTFIERFQPVDPTDVDQDEIASLLALCPSGTKVSTGYVAA